MLIILVYVIFSLVNLYSSYLLKRYALNRYLSYTKKPNEPTTVPLSASISNSSNSSKTGHTSTIRNYDRDRNHSSNTVASINTNKSDVVPEILVNNKPIGSQKPQNTENFDDETKGVDVGRLKGIASFISNDAEDKKWESFKPKYTLDNVTRLFLLSALRSPIIEAVALLW
ncbi:hypothetical protein AX774_g870 [Zancudomyces culisetae]|uniref:Uncharacterized protein n=1 Tax=Zancudomyces culisetae TaxID=1213189 RepID=A0A1R1PXB9_ZANCU|nr:hypothetical protein AX774_g870 [Zancudomyces culisetae]|eukprot:OMH85582.1 hypothetical protein AX774_g870 [Zancudomyces culisetae]